MKKYIFPLLAILMLPSVLTSCFKDDEEETDVSESCYISTVTLGSLKRSIHGYTSKGTDSIYTTTFAGNKYPMSIDQRSLNIENKDSLPIRTNLKSVPLTVTFTGVLVWRKLDLGNAASEDEWNTYKSSDSLDLTTPIQLRVYSLSGKSSRIYTLKVNVHQQNGDSTVWTNMGAASELEGLGERKAIIWGGKLTVIGLDSEGKAVCLTHPLSTTGEWVKQATGVDDALPNTLQRAGNALYMLTSNQSIITSQDGVNWEAMKMEEIMMEELTLVGASDKYLYARTALGLVRSRIDNGNITWKPEKLDDDAANLPTGALNSVYYTLPNGMKRLMIIGSRSDSDTSASIWAKTWDEEDEEEKGEWIYYTPNPTDKYPCPILEDLCVVPYDGGLQALGGKSRNGKIAALESVFHSSDHGITWKTYENNEMDVDPDLKAVAKDAKHITATTDEDHFLWIIVDKYVWRGRINRLGFAKK